MFLRERDRILLMENTLAVIALTDAIRQTLEPKRPTIHVHHELPDNVVALRRDSAPTPPDPA